MGNASICTCSKEMIGQRTKHLIILALMTCVVCLFFARLWYPEPQLYVNPEYGSSDITHFNIPIRQAYWEAIQKGEMPLWNRFMGGGFPLYAESQAGAWYIPNGVLYRILPFVHAFNGSYVMAWLLGMWGMYAWMYHRFKRIDVACVTGWAYVFSGYFIGHIQHLNMLQTASLVPWIGLSVALSRHKNLYWFVALLVSSQQILAGHLQTSFLTGSLLILLELVSYVSKQQNLKELLIRVLLIAGMFVSAFSILAAVQVYPSWELHSLSVRSEAFSLKEVMHFSLHPAMLKTLLLPYAEGSLSDASFTFLTKLSDTGAIFWESWLYMGWIIVVLCVLSVRYISKPEIAGLWGGLLLSMGLMTARYSPLYFVYSIPPFNFFTTPARWSLVFTVFVLILGGHVLQKASRVVGVGILAILLIDLVRVWYSYGVLVPARTVLRPPLTTQTILADTALPSYEKKILSVPDRRWNTEFLQNGWKRSDAFIQLYGMNNPNMNLLWDVTSQNEYVGRIWTRRKSTWDSLIAGIYIPDAKDVRHAVGARALSLSSVDYIVSSQPVALEGYDLLQSSTQSQTIYRTTQSSPRLYVTQHVQIVQSVEDVIEKLSSPLYSGEVFSEEKLDIETSSIRPSQKIQILVDEHTRFQARVESSKKALLVLTDTYYPGWTVYVNEKQAQLYPINIAQRGVIVPQGTSTVELRYQPSLFRIGAWVSVIGHITVLGAVFLVSARKTSSPPATS